MTASSHALLAEACGMNAPLSFTIRAEGVRTVQQVRFNQAFVVIGRARAADIRLRHRDVSWRHAYLQVIDGKLFCVDLQSRSGIAVEEHPCAHGWVEPDQTLQIGPYQLTFDSDGLPMEAWDEAANPLSSRYQSPSPLPTVCLEFCNGRILENRSAAQYWRLDRILTLVGQHRDCKVRFFHPSVSTFHCSLLRTPAGVYVVDLLGRDGILLNGRQIRWALLTEGDTLQVGRFRMRVHTSDTWVNSEPESTSHRYHASPQTVVADATEPTAVSVSASTDAFMFPGMPQEPEENDSTPPTPVPTVPQPTANSLVPTSGGFSANRETVEAILMPFMGQFSVMQKQMFDQFQQTIMIMAQMFSSLHRDQMNFIREELNRLQELTDELADLQVELTHYRNLQKEQARASANGARRQSTGAGRDTKSATGNGTGDGRNAKSMGSPPPSKPKTGSTQTDQQMAAGSQPQRRRALQGGMPIPQGESAADVHDWLCKRFESLQQERQTRWQKLLATLTGTNKPEGA